MLATWPTSFPTLVTAPRGLNLREITASDHNELVEISAYRSDSSQVGQVDQLLETLARDYESGRAITWGIALDEELIGTAGFYRGFDKNTGEIGYVLRTDYRGNGYMTEALRSIVEFGFNQLNLNTIKAFTKSENGSSISVLNTLGFNRTGKVEGPYVEFALSAQA